MTTISLCMIVKNEAKVIERCLDAALPLVDEIIIVDTGSTDQTLSILSKYPVKIYHFAWSDDFASARNFAFSKASMEYQMWLDADDYLPPETVTKLVALKAELTPTTDVVMLKTVVSFSSDGRPLTAFYRERIVKRSKSYQWVGVIHESIDCPGNRLYFDVNIEHRRVGVGDPDRNLRIFRKKIRRKEQLSPRERFYYARELYYHQKYQQAITNFKRFLADPDGWSENKINACRDLHRCYKALNNHQKALEALLLSFTIDLPRAEICCDLGALFYELGKREQSVHWYQQALNQTPPLELGGFYDLDCYFFIPLMQLVMITYQLNDITAAKAYHEQVKTKFPNHPSVVYNTNFFAASEKA